MRREKGDRRYESANGLQCLFRCLIQKDAQKSGAKEEGEKLVREKGKKAR